MSYINRSGGGSRRMISRKTRRNQRVRVAFAVVQNTMDDDILRTSESMGSMESARTGIGVLDETIT